MEKNKEMALKGAFSFFGRMGRFPDAMNVHSLPAC